MISCLSLGLRCVPCTGRCAPTYSLDPTRDRHGAVAAIAFPGSRYENGRLRELSGYRPKTGTKHRYIKRLTALFHHRPLRQPAMSDSAPTPAQDTATPSIDTQQLQQPPPPQSLVQDPQLHAQLHPNAQPTISDPPRKRAYPSSPPVAIFSSLSQPFLPKSTSSSYLFVSLQTPAKAPAVRRACTSCHSGKTRCSEILPCQVCAYLNLFSPYVNA